MGSRQLNITSVYRRLGQLALAIGLLIFVLYSWVSTDLQGKELQQLNSNALTQEVVSQAARVAHHFIVNKQIDQLTVMLNDMSKSANIEQSMVYDQHGTIIAQSANAISAYHIHLERSEPFDALTPINKLTASSAPGKMVISEIRSDDQLLGYLRINYHQHQALIEPLKLHHQLMEQIMLIALLCGVIGFFLTRGFSRFSRNSFRVIDED